MKKFFKAASAVVGLCALFGSQTAQAETIKVGVIISETGPVATLGIPQAHTFKLAPKKVGDIDYEYIVLDDGSDPSKAVSAMRKLISEDKVDVILGSSATPASMAMIEVAGEVKIPMISLAGTAALVQPVEGARQWVFKSAQNDALMADGIAEDMVAQGYKTVGLIGFADSYGDSWVRELTPRLEKKGIKVVANERYARTDTSVTGQVLKLIAAKPDAVVVLGAGTPAVLPQQTLKQRRYQGQIYQTHGVANADFLRVSGASAEGIRLPMGPVVVASQLPENHPLRQSALDYVKIYEDANGANSVSTFGAHGWDAALMLNNAANIAIKNAKPGTVEFRGALRDALENLKGLPLSNAYIEQMSPTDHVGQNQSSRVIGTVENGKWKYLHE